MRLIPFTVLFIFFQIQIIAQTKIQIALNELEKDPEMQYASIGFCAIDINANKIYAELNCYRALTPASSMKVITTGTALAVLGKDYTFKTYLEYSGSISNGTLNGNLYIRGTGDPCLASPMMEGVMSREELLATWLAAIQKAGIKKINGHIVGDASYFDDQVMIPTWQWGDIGNHYGAGVWGLNYHDNLYYMHLKQTKSAGGMPTIDHTIPVIPNLKFENLLVSAGGGTGDNAYVYTAPYSEDAVIRGTIPKGSGLFDIKGAMPDPALVCAYDLRSFLVKSDIPVSKEATTQRQLKNKDARTLMHTYISPTLAQICKHTNEDSRNMYCEALLKTIGMKQKGLGTTDDGIAAVSDFWRARGLGMDGFFMQDGCGLSARNAICAKTFAEVMRKMYIDSKTFGDFYNQLPIAGQTGTMKTMCRNSSAENNVRAKSGSMNRIRSFTGYVTTKSGAKLAFSMIVNNYSCSGYAMKKKLENLMIAMAESE